jgi:hypothetical protein
MKTVRVVGSGTVDLPILRLTSGPVISCLVLFPFYLPCEDLTNARPMLSYYRQGGMILAPILGHAENLAD